jgi:DNA-binding NarL/FixJ family response regulator
MPGISPNKMQEQQNIRIILSEDHNIVRDGLRLLFEGEPGFTIAAEAKNGREVLDLLEKDVDADILLTDINMPVINGMELTGLVHAQYPDLKIVVLSALDNEKYVIRAFKAGAEGFVLKSIAADELKFAVRHVFAGNKYICSELTSKFLQRILSVPEPVELKSVQDVSFSEREVEVIALLAAGMTNQEIADKLFTSKRTIEGYRETMIGKTGVRNTAALVHFAVSHGIIN